MAAWYNLGLLRVMHITPSNVSAIISKVDSHKPCGIDVIPTIISNKCFPKLNSVLSMLYNKFFGLIEFQLIGNLLL